MIFFFFLFFFNLYRGFIAVLKYVRSYLHSLSLVTETNKIIYCKEVFSVHFANSAGTTSGHRVALQHTCLD